MLETWLTKKLLTIFKDLFVKKQQVVLRQASKFCKLFLNSICDKTDFASYFCRTIS